MCVCVAVCEGGGGGVGFVGFSRTPLTSRFIFMGKLNKFIQFGIPYLPLIFTHFRRFLVYFSSRSILPPVNVSKIVG